MNETHAGQTDMNLTIQVIVITSQVINFCIGLPLHCYIMYLLLTKNRGGSGGGGGGGGVDVMVIFALNLTIVEILYCLVAALYCVCIFSFSLCIGTLLGFWLGTCLAGRYLFQCCLCLEQYVAVIHPIIFLKLRPLRYRVWCSAVVCACALGLGIYSGFMFPRLPYNAFGVVYFIVLVLDTFCCLSVLKALVRPGPGERDNGQMDAAKKKAFKIISMNLLTFLVQVLPIFISFSLMDILPSMTFQLGVSISMCFNIAGGFVHPVYCLYKYNKLPFCK